jgi:haloalkane dehalogenase
MDRFRTSLDQGIQSRFTSVLGSRMHFLYRPAHGDSDGSNDPIVCVHGVPTSSYLWRHVMPACAAFGPVYAPDLIGMGYSGKPDIAYTVQDHIAYFEAWMNDLGLDQVTLVLHAWGSVVGFEFARRYPNRIKSLVFYEAHVRPVMDWSMLSLPVKQLIYTIADDPKASIVDAHYMIEQYLAAGMIDRPSEHMLNHYRAPFVDPADRKPLLQYIHDLPIGVSKDDAVVALIEGYSQFLQQTSIPKCLLYAVPGFITTMDTIQWASEKMPELTLMQLGQALHYAQETMPEHMSACLLDWLAQVESQNICETS